MHLVRPSPHLSSKYLIADYYASRSVYANRSRKHSTINIASAHYTDVRLLRSSADGVMMPGRRKAERGEIGREANPGACRERCRLIWDKRENMRGQDGSNANYMDMGICSSVST